MVKFYLAEQCMDWHAQLEQQPYDERREQSDVHGIRGRSVHPNHQNGDDGMGQGNLSKTISITIKNEFLLEII